MPQPNRPRPVHLNATPRGKTPPKGKNRQRSRKSGEQGNAASILGWTALVLVILLALLICAYFWVRPSPHKTAPVAVAPSLPLPEPVPVAPAKPITPPPPVVPPPPKPVVVEHPKTLKELADAQTQQLIGHAGATGTTTATGTATPSTTKPKTPAAPALPPVVQPVAVGQIKGAPARALPLDPNKLDSERIAAYQVALERIHFSCGFVDGDQGMRTQRMLRAYQASRGLPTTGVLDQATRDAIGEPGEPFLNYTVTADDIASIMPKPPTWKAKAAATRLGYNDIWELLAEKFHCARIYLKQLNPSVKTPVAGTEIIGPKVYPAAPIPHATSLRISLSDTTIEALDAKGKIIAFFPCSIAKDKAKRPNGILTVKVVDPNPDYTFDPALFADSAKAENITHKMLLPPGPRNPVGTAWVGLSLPGYGIHGTPAPEQISATQSHGCFRLANWNANKVLKMVNVGTPVDVQP